VTHGSLDGGFFVVACGEAGFGMDAGDSHEEGVRVDLSDGLNRGGSDGDDGVAEETSSDEDDLDVLVVDEFEGDGWAVGDDGGIEVERDVSRDLPGGGAAVEDYDLAWLNHLCCCAADRYFAFGGDVFAHCEVCDGGGGGEGSAVNALEEALVGHLAKVATDGVFRNAHSRAYFFCDDLALALEDGEDLLFSVSG